MADTEDKGGEDTAAVSTADIAPPAKAVTTKKKIAKKATTKKKIVAKKATKKAVTKKVDANVSPASTPIEPPPAASQPVWDDDAGERGLLHWCVKLGPVAILIILMVVLGASESEPMTSGAIDQSNPGTAESVVADATLPALTVSYSTSSAIVQSSADNPWPVESINLGSGAFGQDDPGAFYWGATILDEAPPAPTAN